MTQITGVPALIPLSLLEAIRGLDTPLEDGLEEISPEIVAKRLGLSATVAAQIERYAEAMDDGDPVGRDEAVGVFRLVGRRPDANLAFADAGRRAARHAARGAGRSTATLVRMAPTSLGRRLGLRAAGQVIAETFSAELLRGPGALEVRHPEPLAVVAHPDGSACGFYGSGFAELFRVLAAMEGAMTHDRCRSRGETVCAWVWHDAGDY